MRILITGSTGFVGKNLLKILDECNQYNIATIVRDIERAKLQHKNLKKNITYIEYEKMLEETSRFNPDVCIHLASYLTSKNDIQSIKNIINSNIEYGSILLKALMDTNLKFFINTGSFSEYSSSKEIHSAYFYSATKTAFRVILQYFQTLKNFKIVNVIPYTIYGLGDTQKKVIDYIIDSLDSPNKIEMTEGKQILDFINIKDVVNFYIYILNNLDKFSQDYQEYHLGTGKGTSIRDLASFVEIISGKKTNINWGALPYRKNDVMNAVATNSLNLSWKHSIGLNEGLLELLNFKNSE